MDEREDIVIIGYCAECDNAISNDEEEVYIDEEGNYFCSSACALEYHHIVKREM